MTGAAEPENLPDLFVVASFPVYGRMCVPSNLESA